MNRLSFLKSIPALLGFAAFKKRQKPSVPVIDNRDIIGVSICAFSTTGGTHVAIREGSPTDQRLKESLEAQRPIWEHAPETHSS